MRGQSFYVEVALGCSSSPCKEGKTELVDQAPVMERTFIYPPEAVLVPMMHRAFSRFSSKRYILLSLINCLVCNKSLLFFFPFLRVYGYLLFYYGGSDLKFSQNMNTCSSALCNTGY